METYLNEDYSFAAPSLPVTDVANEVPMQTHVCNAPKEINIFFLDRWAEDPITPSRGLCGMV